MGAWLRLLMLTMLLGGAFLAEAAGFEAANRSFETGDYAAAIAGYEELLTNGQASAAIWFNLGNAYFKDGQFGRGIHCFKQAQRLAPRDADIRANLQFARKEVAGAFAPEIATWQSFFRYLSPREWAWLTAIAGAVLFGLLAVREHLRGSRLIFVWPLRLAVAFALVCGIACPWAHAIWEDHGAAVVVVEKLDVRYGPLEDSKPAYQLKDGEEVRVVGEKDDWRQIRNTSGQVGWVLKESLVID